MKLKAGWIYVDDVGDFLYVHKIVRKEVYYSWLMGGVRSLELAKKILPNRQNYTKTDIKHFNVQILEERVYVHTPLYKILNWRT